MRTVKPATLTSSRLLPTLLAAGLMMTLQMAQAHDAGEETVTPVMQQELPKNPGDRVLLATVNYAPGQASKAHLHAGPIFAYVLEGHVSSQLGDGPVRQYGPGQSWYEAPGTRHMISRNASDTEAAKLLVFAIVEGESPIKQSLPGR
jgi:quercetin dioxygenase-like cupin family protein